MNYVMISPHFPKNLQNFAIRLKERGVAVFGVGSEPYEWLSVELRQALTEYYRVDDMENLEEMKRAIAYLIYRHGPMDRLESNSEYWLETDAQLREQFNIPGVKPAELEFMKYKSKMKAKFEAAQVPVIPGRRVESWEQFEVAIATFGLPVVAKPDRGVGSAATFKLETQADVTQFRHYWTEEVAYFIESYVTEATLCTYDGLIDAQGNVVFETSFYYTHPTLEILTEQLDYTMVFEDRIDPQLAEYGRAAVKAFGMKERFFHIEFFKLANGQYVAVEYNNRLAGGYTIDAYNYHASCDLYDVYAQIVTGQYVAPPTYHFRYALSLTQRDQYEYAHSVSQIKERFGNDVKMIDRLPDVFADIMGNQFFVILADNKQAALEVVDYVHQRK